MFAFRIVEHLDGFKHVMSGLDAGLVFAAVITRSSVGSGDENLGGGIVIDIILSSRGTDQI